MHKWTRIRRDILVEKMSRRKAFRKYNLNFRTVQKILKHAAPPECPTANSGEFQGKFMGERFSKLCLSNNLRVVGCDSPRGRKFVMGSYP